MESQNQTLSIREIVYFLHENIQNLTLPIDLKFHEIKESNSYPFNLEKIAHNWPLQKGSVNKKIIAWNEYKEPTDAIQAFIAYTIKNFYNGFNKKSNFNLAEFKSPNASFNILKIFHNPFGKSFFWEDVKSIYQQYGMNHSTQKDNRVDFVNTILPKNSCILLCLDSIYFRLRSGLNQELGCFENFIEDIYKGNNCLIVFANQKLMHNNKNLIKINNYSVQFKMNKNLSQTSVYEAMEPQSHLIHSSRFMAPQKTGCFDRLMQLLNDGQDYIEREE